VALPTVADLAAAATGTDWPAIIARSFGLWAAGHFDRGQALWTPRPGHGAFAAWRAWATHDLTPEIAGLSGFCAHVAEAPDTAERAVLRAAGRLGLTRAAAETVFHRLLIDLGGWSQHARWLLWEAELKGGSDTTLTDLLAIRLIWEEALLAHCPELAAEWQATVAAHAAPVGPDAGPGDRRDPARGRRTRASAPSRVTSVGPAARDGRARAAGGVLHRCALGGVRRALEAQDAGSRRWALPGFFGLPVAHRPRGTDVLEAHLPVLLNPALVSTGHGAGSGNERPASPPGQPRLGPVPAGGGVLLCLRRGGGPGLWRKLVRDALGGAASGLKPNRPRRIVVGGLTPEQKAETAAAVLRAMSLTTGPCAADPAGRAWRAGDQQPA
jgi:hypothetical protein